MSLAAGSKEHADPDRLVAIPSQYEVICGTDPGPGQVEWAIEKPIGSGGGNERFLPEGEAIDLFVEEQSQLAITGFANVWDALAYAVEIWARAQIVFLQGLVIQATSTYASLGLLDDLIACTSGNELACASSILNPVNGTTTVWRSSNAFEEAAANAIEAALPGRITDVNMNVTWTRRWLLNRPES